MVLTVLFILALIIFLVWYERLFREGEKQRTARMNGQAGYDYDDDDEDDYDDADFDDPDDAEDDYDMTRDYYGRHGEFDINDESRRVSEDMQSFHSNYRDADLSDHYNWDDVLDADTDGYLDD